MTEIFPLSLWSTTPQPSKIWTHHHGYALPVYQTTYSMRVIRQNSRWSVRKRSVIWPSRTVHHQDMLLQRPGRHGCSHAISTPYHQSIVIIYHSSPALVYNTAIRHTSSYDIRGCFGLSWYLSIIMQQSNRWCVLGWRVQNIQQYTREIYQI